MAIVGPPVHGDRLEQRQRGVARRLLPVLRQPQQRGDERAERCCPFGGDVLEQDAPRCAAAGCRRARARRRSRCRRPPSSAGAAAGSAASRTLSLRVVGELLEPRHVVRRRRGARGVHPHPRRRMRDEGFHRRSPRGRARASRAPRTRAPRGATAAATAATALPRRCRVVTSSSSLQTSPSASIAASATWVSSIAERLESAARSRASRRCAARRPAPPRSAPGRRDRSASPGWRRGGASFVEPAAGAAEDGRRQPPHLRVRSRAAPFSSVSASSAPRGDQRGEGVARARLVVVRAGARWTTFDEPRHRVVGSKRRDLRVQRARATRDARTAPT